MTVDAEVATPPEPSPPAPPRRRRRWRPSGRLDIQSRVLLMLLVTSIVSCAVVGVVAYRSGREALRESAFDRLQEVRESRKREITRLYAQLRDSLVIYTRGSTAIDAVDAFEAGFHELEEDEAPLDADATAALDSYYTDVFVRQLNANQGTTSDPEGFVPTNPAARYLQSQYTVPFTNFDEAAAVDDAGDGSEWSAAHARYHDYFRELVERFSYEDALLIDEDGEVVYSVYKGVDLGTDLRDGPWSETSLARAFDGAIASNAVDYVGVEDFERYQPSYGVPTGWVVSPIGAEGEIHGVLALQIPTTALNDVMTGGGDWDRDGLGDTGETYIVGEDQLMRSNSRRVLEDPERYRERAIAAGTPREDAERAAEVGGTILIQPIRNSAVQRAFQGESGEIIERGYLGAEALFAYAPLEFEGLNWVIIVELETSEAFQPARDFSRDIVLTTIAIIVAVCVAALLLAQLFSRPIGRLMAGVRRVAAGELGTVVDARSGDEFGDLGVAFNDMSRSLRVKQDLLEEQQGENQRLLLSLMPANVASRYREGEETITEDHSDVSVVYADLVGFDEYAAGLSSTESMTALNSLVRSFDEAATTAGVDRVRTLRHGYLASCGLVSKRVDHVRRSIDFTLEMIDIVQRFNAATGAELGVRAGVDTGSASSGLVGRNSVAFDLWGDAVSLAYRVQGSDPSPGVFVTSRVYDRLRDSLEFSEAGTIDTQSGPQGVWRLTGAGA